MRKTIKTKNKLRNKNKDAMRTQLKIGSRNDDNDSPKMFELIDKRSVRQAGDGLSALDEYRGFIARESVQGEALRPKAHHRTDPCNYRDIFISMKDDAFWNGNGPNRDLKWRVGYGWNNEHTEVSVLHDRPAALHVEVKEWYLNPEDVTITPNKRTLLNVCSPNPVGEIKQSVTVFEVSTSITTYAEAHYCGAGTDTVDWSIAQWNKSGYDWLPPLTRHYRVLVNFGVFNNPAEYRADITPANLKIRQQLVLTHELGHCLSLTHRNQTGQHGAEIMYVSNAGVSIPTIDWGQWASFGYDRGIGEKKPEYDSGVRIKFREK